MISQVCEDNSVGMGANLSGESFRGSSVIPLLDVFAGDETPVPLQHVLGLNKST